MKIDTSSIEGYAEMTAEQKLAALEAFEYEDQSGEVERLKNAVSKANSEAKSWKDKHNALLSEDEKKKQEDADTLTQMKEELEKLRAEKTISEWTARYIELGYDKELAADTAKAMQAGDMEKVFANSEKHKAAMEQRIRTELMNGTHQPDGNGGSGKDEESEYEKQAKRIGKKKAESNKTTDEVLKHYM